MAYKMKGTAFFGKGEKSPFKVSDEDLVKAQDKLDKTELDWKQPGWAKAAKTVFAPPKLGGGGKKAAQGAGEEGAKGASSSGDSKERKSVGDIAKGNDLKVNADLMKGAPKLEMGAGTLNG
tara:strand:- start:846 stop:1208 length:363 start_codon:yes stop_codon:yes gene_type:complete